MIKVQWLCWKYTPIGLRISRYGAAEVFIEFYGRAQTYWSQTDVFDSVKPSYVMLTFETKIHRWEWFAQVILISVTPMLQILRIGLKKRRNGKSDVGGWPKISQKVKEKIKTAFFSPSENRCLSAPSTLIPEEREFVVDSGASMHDQQKGFEFRWIGNRDDIEKSDDGYNSQWLSTDAWRGHSLSKNWKNCWQWKSSRIRQQFYG